MNRVTPHEEAGDFVQAAVADYQAPLTRYATRLVGDLDRARDVVQDTFIKLLAQSPEAVDGHLAEWLFTVCRNRALDVLRKEGRMARLSEEQLHVVPSPDLSPPDVLERRDDAARALRLLEALPDNQREVLRLKFQNGFSYREIS